MSKYKDIFIEKSQLKHNNLYDYSLVKDDINCRSLVDIICPIHGVFSQKPNKHLSNHGCIYCRESRGERKIDIYLNNKQILFNRQKRFIDCVDKLTLPFDFYLPEYNLCIEFDGWQHFEPVFDFNNGNWFELTKKHDKIKNEYCENKNIKLLRISYKDDI